MRDDEILHEIPLPHADAPSTPPRLLAHRPFLWLVLGDGFANLGRWGFYLAVVGDAAYRLDASRTDLAWLLASFSVPLIFASIGYGVLADRWSPKLLLVATVAGAALVPVVALGSDSLPRLFVASAAYGALHAAVVPGRGALVPRLVPRDRLVQANGMISAAAAVQLVVGPALAAALVVLLGPQGPYAVAIGAAVLSVTCYAMVPDRRRPAGQAISALGEITAGIREGWTTPALRHLFLVGIAVWFLIGILIPLEPLYLQGSLGRGQVFLGIVWAVFGAGEVIGSLRMARLRDAAGREGRYMGAGLLFAGLGFVLYVSVIADAAVIAGNVVFGIGFPMFTAAANGLIQRIAAHPGRVSAAFNVIGESGPVLAAVLLGVAGGLLSVRGWLLASGSLFAVVGLLAFLRGRREAVPESTP